MAVGDIVSQTGTSAFTFQPASGVQVCVTQFLAGSIYADSRVQGRGDINTANIYSSTGSGYEYYMSAFASNPKKWFIDNASYIYIHTAGTYTGFTGIQTK